MVTVVSEGGGRAPARRPASPSAPDRGYDERLEVLATSTLEVVLCLIEGDGVGEIAQFLELSPTTVRRRIEEAKAQLGCADALDIRRRYGRFDLAA